MVPAVSRSCRLTPDFLTLSSPLLRLLDEHVSPERLYLETKWGSLISFELAALVDVEETVDSAWLIGFAFYNNFMNTPDRTSAAAFPRYTVAKLWRTALPFNGRSFSRGVTDFRTW